MKDTASHSGWLGLLGLLFIGLKLGGVIGWSWWWVTAPLWGPLALACILDGIALILTAISKMLEHGKT